MGVSKLSSFKKYLKVIEDSFKTGQATEHTYRAALQNLYPSKKLKEKTFSLISICYVLPE